MAESDLFVLQCVTGYYEPTDTKTSLDSVWGGVASRHVHFDRRFGQAAVCADRERKRALVIKLPLKAVEPDAARCRSNCRG